MTSESPIKTHEDAFNTMLYLENSVKIGNVQAIAHIVTDEFKAYIFNVLDEEGERPDDNYFNNVLELANELALEYNDLADIIRNLVNYVVMFQQTVFKNALRNMVRSVDDGKCNDPGLIEAINNLKLIAQQLAEEAEELEDQASKNEPIEASSDPNKDDV